MHKFHKHLKAPTMFCGGEQHRRGAEGKRKIREDTNVSKIAYANLYLNM